ncbi:MAG: class I adenylate-forming enzyme family protein [Dorea sp.]
MKEEKKVAKKPETVWRGEVYWQEEILDGLEERVIEGRRIQAYQGGPASLYESLLRAERRWPEQVCLVDDDGTPCTFGRFLKLVDGFSVFLRKQYQIHPGEHVGILLYNSIEYCACVYALNRLRAVVVPFSTKYKEPETKSLMEKADLAGIIYHKDFEAWFREEKTDTFQICLNLKKMKSCVGLAEPVEQMPEEQDVAIMMFTSGTTSRSKGVLLKNYNVMHAISVYQKIFHITHADGTVLPVPAYHITGLVAVIGLFLHVGGCVWLHKYFNADRILNEIRKQKITFFHASPTAFSLLLEKKREYPDLLSLQTVACGSGNMPLKKIQEMKEWIPSMEFHTVYGLTETSSPATVFPGDSAVGTHEGSAGCPVPGIAFKICDTRGLSLKARQTGSIFVKGTSVTEGYYRREDLKLEDGWLDTGDIGYFDEDGYLYILDRKKDMINRGGEKVCSYDVENIIYGINGVKEVAVVGIPDEVYGEVPAAMIVPENNKVLREEEIRTYLKSRLAKFQIPAVIVFAGSLPMTPNMKIDKNKIRSLLK